jgi:hypothetical protein
MKTSELTGVALDWAVAKCVGRTFEAVESFTAYHDDGEMRYSTNWAHGGPIIERENISVIRLENESIPDAKGFSQGKYMSQWGAVIGDRHSVEEQHGSQGDYWGRSYHVDEDAVCAETPLIAAMRCYVASKLGADIEIPTELGETK